MFVDSVTELRTEAAPKTHRVKQICDKHRWHGALRTLPARVSPENSDTAPGVPETSGVRVNVIVLTITSDTKNKKTKTSQTSAEFGLRSTQCCRAAVEDYLYIFVRSTNDLHVS